MEKYVCEIGNRIAGDCFSESCEMHTFFRTRPRLQAIMKMQDKQIIVESVPAERFMRFEILKRDEVISGFDFEENIRIYGEIRYYWK